MEDNFSSFVDVARDRGPEGIAAITALVDAAIAAGVGLETIAEKLSEVYDEALAIVEERNQLLISSSQQILDAIDVLVGGVMQGTANTVQFASTAITAAFANMLEAGVPIRDIMEQIGEGVTNIQLRAEELGLVLGEEFQGLTDMMIVFADEGIQRVMDKLAATGDIVEALGNTGRLSADQFHALTSSINSTANQLLDMGLVNDDVIISMQDELQTAFNMQQQYGFSVNATTQAMFDQGLELGVLSDQNMDASSIMIAGFDAMLVALNALITAMGGIPIAFDNWNSSTNATADNFNNQMGTMGDNFNQFANNMTDTYDTTMAGVVDTTTITTAAMDQSWQNSLNNVSDSVESASETWIDSTTTSADVITATWLATADSVGGSLELLGMVAAGVFGDMSDTSLDHADITVDNWREAIDEIRERYNDMIGNLAEPPAIPSGGGGGNNQGIPQFRHGSGSYIDFGTGTRIDVHDDEQIVTRSQGASLANDIGNAIKLAMIRGASKADDIGSAIELAMIRVGSVIELAMSRRAIDKVCCIGGGSALDPGSSDTRIIIQILDELRRREDNRLSDILDELRRNNTNDLLDVLERNNTNDLLDELRRNNSDGLSDILDELKLNTNSFAQVALEMAAFNARINTGRTTSLPI